MRRRLLTSNKHRFVRFLLVLCSVFCISGVPSFAHSFAFGAAADDSLPIAEKDKDDSKAPESQDDGTSLGRESSSARRNSFAHTFRPLPRFVGMRYCQLKPQEASRTAIHLRFGRPTSVLLDTVSAPLVV